MNYEEALEYISSFATVSLEPSLDRIKALLQKIGNPERSLKAFHIAGTNGKGSVVSLISSVLAEKGYKVGTYISPFIIDFCERIQINSKEIERQRLAELATRIRRVIEKEEGEFPLSQFELTTALAFLYFSEQKCDYCVLETGLGGAFDATNVIEKPIISILTKISLDHTKVLGDTVEKIAAEKSGIIKKGVPLITCPQPKGAMEIIKSACKIKGVDLIVSDKAFASEIELSRLETRFTLSGEQFSLPLLGEHQIENALLAIYALRRAFPSIKDEEIIGGFKKVTHPARLEIINTVPNVILDGAHNPDAARALVGFLKKINWKGSILFSAMRDKEYSEVLSILSEISDSIATLSVEGNKRSEKAEQLSSAASRVFPIAEPLSGYREAINRLREGEWLVCGSLFLVADIRKLLQEKS